MTRQIAHGNVSFMSDDSNNANGIRSRKPLQVLRLIRRAGLNQNDIAQRAGCSQAYVSYVLRGYSQPTALSEKVWKVVERAIEKAGVR